MRKKHGPVRTVVRPFGSVNRDQFKRLPCFSLKTALFHLFFPPPPIRRHLEHTLKQKSIEITLKPSITLDLFLTLSITLSSLPLSLIAIAAQPRSLPHSFNHSLPLSHVYLCLSPSSLSQLTLCLVTVTVVWYFITSNLLFLC